MDIINLFAPIHIFQNLHHFYPYCVTNHQLLAFIHLSFNILVHDIDLHIGAHNCMYVKALYTYMIGPQNATANSHTVVSHAHIVFSWWIILILSFFLRWMDQLSCHRLRLFRWLVHIRSFIRWSDSGLVGRLEALTAIWNILKVQWGTKSESGNCDS